MPLPGSVARLMVKRGLVGAHSRRRWRTGKPNTAWAPDLVDRDFNPVARDRVWAADVTQFRTEEGWLHFAGVIDLYSPSDRPGYGHQPLTPTWSSTPW
ncbi:MAG: hypothetical protein U0R78_18315 [Nocardioidaceae bacterium]